MRRSIGDIYCAIHSVSARTTWEKGVVQYADELFAAYLESHGLSLGDIHIRIGKITEADLLRGAPNWGRYSQGGMALVSSGAIIRRLYPRAKQKKLLAQMQTDSPADVLGIQADALAHAAKIVVGAVNWRRDESD